MTTGFDSSALIAQTKEMNKAIAELREEYRKKIQDSFHEAVKSFFVATPEVRALEWTQYTPYWNDGEECTFSVHDVWYYLVGQDSEDFDYAEEAGFNAFSYEDPESIRKAIVDLKAIAEGPDLTSDEINKSPYRYDLGNSSYEYTNERDRWGNYQRAYVTKFNRSKVKERIFELEKELEEAIRMAPVFARRPEIEANYKAIAKFINSIDDSAMEDMFGNHVRVTVTKDGVTTEEYSHE